jgi:chromosome segregation ATPase
MSVEYELDALVEYQVQDISEGMDHPNPARRPLEQALAQAQSRVQRLQSQLGEAVAEREKSSQRTVRGFRIAHASLRAELSEAEQEVTQLKSQLDDLPKRVPANDLKTLTTEKKLIVDTIKMVAYQAETKLLALLREHYHRADDEGRTLLQAAFQSTGRVEVRDDELFVELAPQSSPHKTEAIRALCDQLNDLSAKFPGTDLRLRLAVQPHEPITK